ncbi:MAG: regulatory signaling modulator protein AmpE [Panacagrimonas sp.]
MTLIAILAALIAERLLGHVPGWGSPLLMRRYLSALRGLLPVATLWRGALAIPLVLAPPLLLTWWLKDWLESPLLQLAFSALILFLCLGPRDLADDVKLWLAARREGDKAQADRLARLLLQGPERYSESDAPDSRSLLGALFIQSHERLFGVLLWFFAAGAVGAVGYRLASRLPRLLMEHGEDSPAAEAAETLHALAAWVPARITAVLFGLSGSLDDAIREYARLSSDAGHGWRGHTWAVLADVSSGSLAFENKEGATEVPATLDLAAREVLNLQLRALLIVLAFIAVAAIGGLGT